MTDLIERIVTAIFRQEGMSAEDLNPGNLRGAPWLANPVIKNDVWVPASRAEGIAGAAHVVALHVAKGNTLYELISGWAPPFENDTAQYIANVKEWAEIPDTAVSLWNYL